MGSTTTREPVTTSISFHPYAHGANSAATFAGELSTFLPIRTWGQPAAISSPQCRILFTHAHMGPTQGAFRQPPSGSFHPYAHGANNCEPWDPDVRYFSPMRTWGQRLLDGSFQSSSLFTHAHMGPTWRQCCRFNIISFHPCAHGPTGQDQSLENTLLFVIGQQSFC